MGKVGSVISRAGLICILVVGLLGCSTAKRDAIQVANQGVRLFEQQDFNTAYRYFQRALEIYPEHTTSHYHLGLIDFYQFKRYDRAERNFRKVIALSPQDRDGHVQLGRLLVTRAERTVEGARAAVLQARQRQMAARSTLRRARTEVPPAPTEDMDPKAAAEVLAKREKSLGQVKLLTQQLASSTSRLKTLEARLEAAKKPYHEGLKRGLKVLDDALKLDPNLALAWYFKGKALVGLGELDKADDAWRESLTIKPIDPRAFVALGDLYAKYEAYDAARAVFREGLKFNEDNPDLLTALGVIQLRRNEDKAAIDSFRRVLIKDPDRMDAMFNIAFAYAKVSQPRQAIEYLDTYLAHQKPVSEQARVAKALRAALLPDIKR